jgi:hypothetical protein
MSDAPAHEASRRAEGQRRAVLRSVVPPDPSAEPASAMIVQTVSVTVSGGRASVSVEVREGGAQSTGLAEGACAGNAVDRLVADATLRAVAGIDQRADVIAVDAVTVEPAGSRHVATAVLVLGDTPLVGVAVVGPSGAADAVARAVVDALARRSASS